MAAMIGSKRATLSKLLEKIAFSPLRPAMAAPSVSRSFNTSSQLREYEEDRDLDRRDRDGNDAALSSRGGGGDAASFPSFFLDVLDPFNTTRSLSQVLNLMDQMLDNPFTTASRGGIGNLRRGWDAREDNDALYLRVDMPGLGKEHVKVWAEQNTLVIKGEGEKEPGEEESGGKYSSRIDLPADYYKMDEVKAEMKNGVLKVVVPKVKAEERKDVFEVKIQ